MMYCVNKENGLVYRIYDIVYDSSGYPSFLYYDNGKWIRTSAKYFCPIEPELFDDGEFDSECDGLCRECGGDNHILH